LLAYRRARSSWCSGLSPWAWSSVETRIQMPTGLFKAIFSFIDGFISKTDSELQEKCVCKTHIFLLYPLHETHENDRERSAGGGQAIPQGFQNDTGRSSP